MPGPMSPKANRTSRKKFGLGGRTHYVLYTGVFGWGMSMFLMMTFWHWHEKYGWHVPLSRRLVFFNLSRACPCGPLGGYAWGAVMWSYLIERVSATRKPTEGHLSGNPNFPGLWTGICYRACVRSRRNCSTLALLPCFSFFKCRQEAKKSLHGGKGETIRPWD